MLQAARGFNANKWRFVSGAFLTVKPEHELIGGVQRLKERSMTTALFILESEIRKFKRTGNLVHLAHVERALEELMRALELDRETMRHGNGARDTDGTSRRRPGRPPIQE
jgi:hypothetical protein